MTVLNLSDHFKAVADIRDAILNRRTLLKAYNMPCDGGSDVAELTRLVEKTSFSKTYQAEQKRIITRFNKQLAALPDLEDAVARWPRMRRRDQTFFLERCATMLAEIQSQSGVTVRPAAIQWRDDKAFRGYEGRASYDLQDPDGIGDLIEMRAVCRSGSDNIAEAIDTLVHEQTHIYQACLARASLFQTIKKSHPLYVDAALAAFALVKGYVPHDLGEAYRAQCVEQDAFRAGHAARDFMKAVRSTLRADNDNRTILTGVAVAGLAYLAVRALARPS